MFTTPLDLRADRPGRWIVLKPLIWNALEQFVVPAQFVTDLASIPRPLRGILNQNGNSRRPAVLHDFLYRLKPVTRVVADAIFRRALIAEGVNPAVAAIYWLGVRSGGWMAWKNAHASVRARKRWK